MATAKAIRVHAVGGPDQLVWEEVPIAEPGPGIALVRNQAVGLNFIDTYHRSGKYPLPLPFTPGSEGAGVVEAVGPGVKDLRVGDRVGYVGPVGAYAELLLRPVAQLVKLPAHVETRIAAAAMLKGMTAEYLLRRTYRVKAGQTVLVHAAAGGVGQILCQWAKHLGATVIGTVGHGDKAALAKKVGCAHVIVTADEPLVARVKQITSGAGVPVVYDGIGKDTFLASLDCLSPRGTMVSYGSASGPVAPFDIALLMQKGSLYLTRPTLGAYTATRAELVKSARSLFSMIESGAVKITIAQTYPLRDAARAHRDLEARKTTGSTLLLP